MKQTTQAALLTPSAIESYMSAFIPPSMSWHVRPHGQSRQNQASESARAAHHPRWHARGSNLRSSLLNGVLDNSSGSFDQSEQARREISKMGWDLQKRKRAGDREMWWGYPAYDSWCSKGLIFLTCTPQFCSREPSRAVLGSGHATQEKNGTDGSCLIRNVRSHLRTRTCSAWFRIGLAGTRPSSHLHLPPPRQSAASRQFVMGDRDPLSPGP